MFGTKTKENKTDVELNPGDKLVSTGKGGEKYTIVIPSDQSEALKDLKNTIDYIVSGITGVKRIEKIVEFVNNNIKDNSSWKGNNSVVDLDEAINKREGGETEKTIILYLLLKYEGYDVYYNEGTKTYYDFTNAPKNMTINKEKYRVNIPHYSWLTLNINGKHYLIDPEGIPSLMNVEELFVEYKKESVQIKKEVSQ